MTTTKKRVLIGLFGLSRTFKQTSEFLFDRIILPNSDNFDFDIVINTDFDSTVLTAYRNDNKGSISKFKYNNLDTFRADLTECYNRNGQLKDIIIYNKETHFVVFPWLVVYKRIQQILQNRYEKQEKYDIYIMLRLDIIINKILHLNNVHNEIVLVSGSFTRSGYLHDRDIDGALYGNYEPFMYWVYSIIKCFEGIVDRKIESVGFFDRKIFCSNEIIQRYTLEQLNCHKIYMSNQIYKILQLVKLNHTDCEMEDKYNFNNSIVKFNFSKYYNIPNDYLIRNLLFNINAILHFSTFQLSENSNNMYYHIMR